MGQVTVTIGGRSYPLACRDGDEAHLTELADIIESKTGELATSLGSMSEPRLLLMAGILVADELIESRKQHAAALAGSATAAVDDAPMIDLAERLEALADSLEHDLAEAA